MSFTILTVTKIKYQFYCPLNNNNDNYHIDFQCIIQVKVMEPNLKANDCIAKLNKDNNMEWVLKIDSQKTEKLALRYILYIIFNHSYIIGKLRIF